jgi:hypothetical protein
VTAGLGKSTHTAPNSMTTMPEMHFLILGMRSGKTACGLQIYAFFPQTETAYVGRRTCPALMGSLSNARQRLSA